MWAGKSCCFEDFPLSNSLRDKEEKKNKHFYVMSVIWTYQDVLGSPIPKFLIVPDHSVQTGKRILVYKVNYVVFITHLTVMVSEGLNGDIFESFSEIQHSI